MDAMADAQEAMEGVVGSMHQEDPAAGDRLCPEGCHTAEPDEVCYKAVQWARTVGIVDHPEWYPTLREDSTWEEFQSLLQQGSSDEVDCKPPCEPCEGSTDGADAEDFDGMGYAYEDSAGKGAIDSLST